MNSEQTLALRKEFAMTFDRWAPQNRSLLIFIDESGFNLHLRRSRARSFVNTRAVLTIPTVMTLLPAFQSGLQKFAASFEILRSKHSSTTSSDCKARRQKVLDEMSAKLAQLLCELDKTMSDLQILSDERLQIEEETIDSMKNYDRDITTGQVYDWGVLSTYEDYVTDWHKIVRQVVGPKGDAKCPNRPHRNKIQPLPT
ncbi:hypothetical protein GE061_007511 [Apolygus lucorum]|uniref:Uncharacterized protein n=1 Tax=Apolygus lucorum TaxID=248454 RepID=A0A8S9WVY9_APOLU|nr:hypothetical protein GE061_007511 [Apolygus lucorum]